MIANQHLERPVDAAEREHSARLIEEMLADAPWREQMWARMALAIAARAVRRGRHLTEAEKLENLAAAMADDPEIVGR